MLEALVQNAALAWNPIGHIRERVTNGTLNIGAVLATCVGVAIASNLASFAALSLYRETLGALPAGSGIPDSNPVLQSKLFIEFITILALLPAAALALLPKTMFSPSERNPTIAAILIVMSSSVFFSSAALTVGWILAALATPADSQRGVAIFTLGGFAAALVTLAYLTVIWRRATRLLHIRPLASAMMVGVFLLTQFALISLLGAVMGGPASGAASPVG